MAPSLCTRVHLLGIDKEWIPSVCEAVYDNPRCDGDADEELLIRNSLVGSHLDVGLGIFVNNL